MSKKGQPPQKCIFCNKKYVDKQSLYDHIEKYHQNQIPKDISIAQYVFNTKYNKTFGSCVICKKKTKWNEAVERYDRLCSAECKDAYREAFRERMMDKHGAVHLLNSPEQQRKMLANRKISGKYLWSDGISRVTYTGSYELGFLKFLDVVLNFSANDVLSPAPQNFYYKDKEGRTRFYFPDFYIPSLNLIIEIKDGGDNPNNHPKIKAVDKELEKIKDQIMMKQKNFNYIKVSNKDYSSFIIYLMELKNRDPEKCKVPLIQINESVNKIQQLESKYQCYLNKLNESTDIVYNENIESIIDNIDLHDIDKEPYLESLSDIIFNKSLIYLEDKVIINEDNVENKVVKIYGLPNEKMYPLNNIDEVKKAIRNFKNCPKNKRATLAKAISLKAKEYSIKINSASIIWNYIKEDKEILKESHSKFHDNKCVVGNDKESIKFMKLEHLEQYPNINALLDNARNIFISSDYHLFCEKRKNLFVKKKLENLNEIIIENHNQLVDKKDVFIFLGDLVNDEFIAKQELQAFCNQLNGKKILVLGNNDVFEEDFYSSCGFDYVVKGFMYKNFAFSHYPLDVSHTKDIINIHGHIHGCRSYFNMPSERHIDGYIDLHGYKPVRLEDLINLYNRGFFNGTTSGTLDFAFDTTFEKQRLSESISYKSICDGIGSSIEKSKKLLTYKDTAEKYSSFKLMNYIRPCTVTNVKGSSDGKGSYYAVYFGLLNINEEENCENLCVPCYILGVKSMEFEIGHTVSVRVVGVVERANGEEILIAKYVHNNFKYSSLQILSLIYPQERHAEFDLYLYDDNSKVTTKIDLEIELQDPNSEEFMEKLVESIGIDVDGNILIKLREKSNFMSKYMTTHKLLVIYEQTNSIENIKHELCKLYYMYSVIETYYSTKRKSHPLEKFLKNKRKEEALKAKVFILNDFTKYLKFVLTQQPDFNFTEYFCKTEYYKDILKIKPEYVSNVKKFITKILL